MSSRLDVLPPEITKELEGLQDEVPPVPFPAIRALAEAELGVTLERAFSFIDPIPLAAASLGQVQRARLSETDAADTDLLDVVVKIQRPGISTIVDPSEVADQFARFGGMGFAELQDVDPCEFRAFAVEFGDVVRTLPFQLPENCLLIVRAMSLTSGMCSSLDLAFTIWNSVEPYSAQLIRAEGGNLVQAARLSPRGRKLFPCPVAPPGARYRPPRRPVDVGRDRRSRRARPRGCGARAGGRLVARHVTTEPVHTSDLENARHRVRKECPLILDPTISGAN